ncbi:hypothetical protein ACFYV7_23005 [Nocardia suismassiliense]|uniref:ATP-binding protein n=1 Tax=Nocardia suismassiliense TaxID=2077092 RepID=A0ABW6QWN9_9NOCA
MPNERPSLYGLHAVTRWLVEHLLSRPNGRSRNLPVVVALGPRGTGKTALLREVECRCERIPHAYLDFERSEREPREVLGELAFELSKHWKQFGRLAFPQLWLCLLIVGSTLHTRADNRREAIRQLRKIVSDTQPIEQNRTGIVELVQSTGTATSGLPLWAAPAADGLLRGLGWFGRRRLLRNVPRLPGAQGSSVDVLIDLAKWANDDRADVRDDVDAIFFEAFLHDLRRAYAGFNGSRRTLNCIVLLDNVHTPAGRKFLLALQEARRRVPGESDPMVVFASSRTWIPYWSDSWHRPGAHRFHNDDDTRPREHRTGDIPWPSPRTPSDIDADWPDTDSRECPWNPWYLLDLSRLTTEAIADLADDVVGQGMHADRWITDFTRGLTAGHPGGTVEVLTALARSDDRERPTTARKIFDSPLPQPVSETETVESTVRERARGLLRDFGPPPARRDLVTVSAARNVDMLYRPEVLDSAVPNGELLLETLRNQLWIREEFGRGPDLAINPWLRRILLQELADRPDTDPRDWTRTHTLCRDIYRRDGQEAAAHYHDLALGDLGAVVGYLGRPFESNGAEFDVPAAAAWLSDLDLITSAPNCLGGTAAPIDQVAELVRGNGLGPDNTLAWLVACLWVSNDLVADPERALNHTIENEFRQLARGRGRGAGVLHERAEKYR